MNPSSTSLIVAMVGPDRKRAALLTRLGTKLRQRGLQAHHLCNGRESTLNGCEILLIGCAEKELDSLARQIESLWTQNWSSWYEIAREKQQVNPMAGGALR